MSKARRRMTAAALAKSNSMVRAEGLEPPRLSPLVPKTSASTNSATPAGPIALRASKRSAAIIGRRCYTHFGRAMQQKNDGSAKHAAPARRQPSRGLPLAIRRGDNYAGLHE